MDLKLLAISALMLTSAHAWIHEATSAQSYWRSILSQTPIPASIQELLRQEFTEREMTSFGLERPPTHFISYKRAASEKQIKNDPNALLFFLKDSLNPGTKMTLDLTKTASTRPFLSAEKAMAAPFSSAELPKILSLFNIEHDSPEEVAIRRTLAECEEQAVDGEKKRCVTSMEAMVEFVEAELGGRDVRVVETALTSDRNQVAPKQEYVVGPEGGRRVRAESLVSCHPEPYPRAVYYCHTTTNIEAYKVRLFKVDEEVVDVVATCHTDTSAWDPNYIGFKMLKVKPGTESICHFLPPGHLIFTGKSKKDTSTR